MAMKACSRIDRGSRNSALRVVAVAALATSLLCLSTVAKASRYDVHATPSKHLSTSVKVARVLFHNWLSAEPLALAAPSFRFPEPDRHDIAPLSTDVEARGTAPLVFRPLRAPPAEV